LTDFVCLYNYEFGLSLCKIVRSSVILLLPLFNKNIHDLGIVISIRNASNNSYQYRNTDYWANDTLGD
jgi:hypothetical protein